MNCARFAAAAIVGASLIAGTVYAQTPKAPDLKPILSGKKFTPPVHGQATIDLKWPPVTKRVKDTVVTTMVVKNTSPQPIARLAIDEIWYDKGGNIIAGGKGLVNGLLQPEEIQTVTIETPWKVGMLSNNYEFSHANGTVKPNRVKTLGDEPKKEEPAKKGPAKKKK
ncbi:MAG: hypothetical protein ACM3SQ_16850 [Betaproteobacteria bacterium]